MSYPLSGSSPQLFYKQKDEFEKSQIFKKIKKKLCWKSRNYSFSIFEYIICHRYGIVDPRNADGNNCTSICFLSCKGDFKYSLQQTSLSKKEILFSHNSQPSRGWKSSSWNIEQKKSNINSKDNSKIDKNRICQWNSTGFFFISDSIIYGYELWSCLFYCWVRGKVWIF